METEQQPVEPNIYFIRLICSNCGAERDVSIRKGNTIKEFCASTSCHNCGCFEYRAKWR